MNMPILTQFGNSEQSMTSLEISELVQSRHDKVKQSVERLAERGVITLPPMGEKATAGRPTTFYVFSGEQGKLDSITVVAQLCPEFTAAIVKRWYELESKGRLKFGSSKSNAPFGCCVVVFRPTLNDVKWGAA